MKSLPQTGTRLAILGKNSIEFQPFDVRPPEAGEVVIETIYSLLSTGTETIVFSQKFDADTAFAAWVRYPFYPGYSSVGTVLAAGEGVGLRPGQRVVTRTGHASHAIVKAETAFPVPDEVESEAAVWFALAKICGHGVRAARLNLGETVAVIGAGPIGQMATRWALVCGASRVVVVDIAPERLKFAERVEAITVAAPAADAVAEVRKVLGGERPAVVIDSTGNAEVLQSALRMVETEGTVVLLGTPGNPTAQCLTDDVIPRGLKLVGAHDARNSPQWNNQVAASCFFEFLRTGRLSVDGLVTHRFLPSQCVEAYALASTDRLRTMGVLFDWSRARDGGKPRAAVRPELEPAIAVGT